jgi:hypothetical protein
LPTIAHDCEIAKHLAAVSVLAAYALMQQGLQIPGDANERRRIQWNLKVLDTVSWVTLNCVAFWFFFISSFARSLPDFHQHRCKTVKGPSICGADLGAII